MLVLLAGLARADDVCERDFAALVEVVSTSHAAFDDLLEAAGPETVDEETDRLRGEAMRAQDPLACDTALREWLAWFQACHTQLSSAHAPPLPETNAPLAPQRATLTWPTERTAQLTVPALPCGSAVSVEELLRENRRALRGAENLLIDLRGNKDGCFDTLAPLRRLVVTAPAVETAWEVRASRANSAAWETAAASIPDGDASQQAMADAARRLNRAEGDWVPLSPPNTLLPSRAAFRGEHVGVLVDGGCCGTCEGLVLEARQSPKVLVLGAPTAGCVDYGEVRAHALPSGSRTVWFETARRAGAHDDPATDGIEPDHLVDGPEQAIDLLESFPVAP